MKSITLAVIAFVICGSAFAEAKPPPVKLICPTKDDRGQNPFTYELLLDEANGKVGQVSAGFWPDSVVWNIQTGPEYDFTWRLDRHTGELTVSAVSPHSGKRHVFVSGWCRPSNDERRKF